MPREKQVSPLGSVFHGRDLLNPYLLVGAMGRMVGQAARANKDTYSIRSVDRLLGGLALSNPEPIADQQLTDIYASVGSWHGTGRYQYCNGKIVDVLDGIGSEGLILPNHDEFDLTRPMRSVSLARSRMYGRAYADMHGRGMKETNRYGSSLFWACAFLGDIAVEASIEARIWTRKGYERMTNHLSNGKTMEWYKKLTSMERPSVISVYGKGSDIEDNYPILIGIHKDVAGSRTSRAVALHEVRVERPIDIMSEVTHLEVPYLRIEDTRRMISRSLPIIPIERAESHMAQYPFSSHMIANYTK